MKFILGKKIGMTQVFKPDGTAVAVTKVAAGPCQIVQVKERGQNNALALQLGLGEKREFRVPKPERGHLRGLKLAAVLHDFAVDSTAGLMRGDIITVETFAVGDKVTVVGTSKGKGFAGVVKRHHFKGAPKSHGHKHDLRAPGSIGAGGVQRVFKGMRMAGRLGGSRVTVKNLEVVAVLPDTNELAIKGAIPGSRHSVILISAPGELKVTKPAEPVETVVPQVPVAEPPPPAKEAPDAPAPGVSAALPEAATPEPTSNSATSV